MKQALCIYLPHWPIDRLRRRRPALRHEPMVLVHTAGNRQTVVHVSPEIPPAVYPGMALAEARARCAQLLDLPADPAADGRSLAALGRRMMRYSPLVCVSPPQSLILDATGLDRLYGGLPGLLGHVRQALADLRIAARLAIAPTPGAAWALAAFAGEGPRLIDRGHIAEALAPLPIAALRLEERTVALLWGVGVKTVGQLLQLPRNDLVVRFGSELLTRIDQAMGAMHEPMQFLPPRTPISAHLEFDAPIDSLEMIRIATRALIDRLSEQLSARGLGAKEIRLTFRQPYDPPVEKMIRLIRPTRDAAALAKLLECALEQVAASEGSDGFIAAAGAVTWAVRLGHEQAALIEDRQRRDAEELDHLVDRLRARLEDSVEWGELLESHLPEYSSRCRQTAGPPVLDGPRRAVDLLRPTRLLRRPRPIDVMVRPSESREGHPISFTDRGRVHRLDHLRGPERITGPWWAGRWKIRDYFDVLDRAGQRFWIFRVAQTGRWFLHGVFE